MKPRLALAVSAGVKASAGGKDSAGAREDRRLVRALGRRGLDASLEVWNGDADWDKYDGVLIRSCWDYHLQPEAFRRWLDRLEERKIRVWNPPSLVRWNMDKRYLLALATKGLPIVPTLVRDGLGPEDFPELQQALDTEHLVVKPVIGASSYGIRWVRSSGDMAPRPGKITIPGPWLIQPFIGEVRRDGEWSLVWFRGELSHAVLKRAAPGEFRVQRDWGGVVESCEPEEDLVETAGAILESLDTIPLYARVDMVRWRGRPWLMELELIEPELFFTVFHDEMEIFSAIVAARLTGAGDGPGSL